MKSSERFDEEWQLPSVEEIKSSRAYQEETQESVSNASLCSIQRVLIVFTIFAFLLGFFSMTLVIKGVEHSSAETAPVSESDDMSTTPESRLRDILKLKDENIFLDSPDSYQLRAMQRMRNSDKVYVTYSDVRLKQVYGLLSLYFAANDCGWSNAPSWHSAYDECTWDGITCNSAHLVEEIDLSGFGLDGVVPIELVLVESVRVLRLDDNPDLTGKIPSFFGRMNLDILSLTGCGYVGEMPDELCQSKIENAPMVLKVDCWDRIACDEFCCENCSDMY